MLIVQNSATASQRAIAITLLDAATNQPVAGQAAAMNTAGNAKVKKPGVAVANAAGTFTDIGGGHYEYAPSAGEINALGELKVWASYTGFFSTLGTATVIARDVHTPNALTVTDEQRITRIAERSAGFVWYCTPAGGGSGLTPSQPTTLAVCAAAATAGDVIVVMPGQHTLGANISLADGVKLVGCGAEVSRILRVTTTNDPAISIGTNNVIEDVEISNLGSSVGQPIGSTTTTMRRIYNSTLRRVTLRSPMDTVVVSTGNSLGRHKLRLVDCDLDSDFDNVAIFTAATGTPCDIVLERCRMFTRGSAARSVYIVHLAGNTEAVRVYLIDCIGVRRSAGGVGGVIDVSGGNVEVRLSGCIVEASELGGADSFCVRALDNAKVISDGSTIIDETKVSTSSGGSIVYETPEDALIPPTAPPAANASPRVALAWLLARARNKVRVTDSLVELLADDDSTIAEFDLADDGTTLTQDKAESPA